MKDSLKRLGRLRRIGALCLVVSVANGCADKAATKARHQLLAAIEERVARADLGTLLLHRVYGQESISGTKPFRTSYYARDDQSADQVKAALTAVGFAPIRIDQRCDLTDPCAFTDPDQDSGLLSVVIAPSSAIARVDKVKLPDGDVIVASVF